MISVYPDGKIIEEPEEVFLNDAYFISKIEEIEQEQTPRLMRDAIMGDQFAKDKLESIEMRISALRSAYREWLDSN